MRTSICILLLSSVLGGTATPDAQRVLGAAKPSTHHVDPAILAALDKHPDPVDAYVYLHPEAAKELAEPRFLHVHGDAKPKWLTEGDKLRLRRKGRKFADITEHHEFYAQQVNAMAGQARTLPLAYALLSLQYVRVVDWCANRYRSPQTVASEVGQAVVLADFNVQDAQHPRAHDELLYEILW